MRPATDSPATDSTVGTVERFFAAVEAGDVVELEEYLDSAQAAPIRAARAAQTATAAPGS